MNEASASASARRSASVSATAIQLSFPVLFGGASVGESFEGLTSGGATGWSACGAIWWFSTSNSISSDSSAPLAESLKITEKVSYNIASEASYIYILIKNAKNSQFDKACNQTVVPDRSVLIDQNFIKNDQYGQFGEMPKTCSQTVLPDMAISIRQKLVEKAKYSQNGDFLQSKNNRQGNLDWTKIGGKYQN